MTEFIGSRISLISKRDIRYVGTLHQISSENSTVALEQVTSYGTEDRRPDDVVPPSLDNVYEYIVFRGSDVKDLRIEEGPKYTEPKPPKVPDDPAILGSTRKPTPSKSQAPAATPPQNSQQGPQTQHQNGPPPPQNGPPGQSQFPAQHQLQFPPHMQQQQQYPPQFPPPNQRFGPQGFPPPGPGFPGMPYGAPPPPGWYPPYGFPQMPPGQFPHHQMPIGPPGQNRGPMPPPGPPGQQNQDGPQSGDKNEKPTATVRLPSSSNTPIPLQEAPSAPPPVTGPKKDVPAALAPPATAATTDAKIAAAATSKSGRIVPAVPRKSPAPKPAAIANVTAKATSGQNPAPALSKAIEEANRDARAAVASAMAKLPLGQTQTKTVDKFQDKPQDNGAMDNLTKKVNEMRTNDTRPPRHQNAAGYDANARGRGRGRGGPREPGRRMEVPKTDYDFESANAKFNKQDLVNEAIASGSPAATPVDESEPNGNVITDAPTRDRTNSETVVIPAGKSYSKSSSFFDNISSEIKDRAEKEDHGQKMGGREFRSEERQKNMETFGEGSVDNGFRYGRGRGRGRGRGFRGGRGRGAPRGRGGVEA